MTSLPVAVLAENQNCQLGVSYAANRRAERVDRRAGADQPRFFGRLIDNVPMAEQQLLELLRVFERDRGVRGQFDERLLVIGREVTGQFVDDLEGAAQLAAGGAQWHAQQRARFVTERAGRPGD